MTDPIDTECPCFTAPNREAAMIVVADGVWCDPCIAPLVKALNDGGVPTVASCCGHKRTTHSFGNICLTDGRVLTIHPNLDAAFQTRRVRKWKVRPIFAWYDLWVGVFVDHPKRRIYIFPLPMFGIVVSWGREQ